MSPLRAVRDDWWEEFFDRDYHHLFADAIDDAETERAVNDLIRLVGIRPGWRVLDAPGGSGRHAVPLAVLGCEVTLVDRSGPAVTAARAAATAADVDLRIVRGDLRGHLGIEPEPPHGPPYELVANLFNSFGYFADEGDDRAMLAGLADVVADGGWLVLEVANPAALLAEPSRSIERLDDATVHVQRRVDPDSGRLHVRYRLHPHDGTPPRETGTIQRLWTADELVALVDACGLQPAGVFGDLDARPLDDAQDWLVVVARRPATSP